MDCNREQYTTGKEKKQEKRRRAKTESPERSELPVPVFAQKLLDLFIGA